MPCTHAPPPPPGVRVLADDGSEVPDDAGLVSYGREVLRGYRNVTEAIRATIGMPAGEEEEAMVIIMIITIG